MSGNTNKRNMNKQSHLRKGNITSYNKLYRDYSYGARRRNYKFDLSFTDFKKLISSNCYFCNKIPNNKFNPYLNKKGLINGKKTNTINITYIKELTIVYNGIDRLDNTKGYTKKNSVSCCKQCNFLKADYSSKEFLSIIKNIYEHKIKKGPVSTAEETQYQPGP